MKKIASLVLVLMLCLAMTAFAVPSKTTGDLISITTSAPGLIVKAVPGDAAAEAELPKLAEAASVEEYFNAGDLKAIVGADALNVNEFAGLAVENYEDSMGDVTVTLLCGTQYPEGDKVAVMVGLVETAEDGTQNVTWNALEGSVIDNLGRVETTMPGSLLKSVQDGTGLLAIVSK